MLAPYIEYCFYIQYFIFIKIDQKNKVVFANGLLDSTGVLKGKPIFTEGAQTYDAQELAYNFETKKGKIKEVIIATITK